MDHSASGVELRTVDERMRLAIELAGIGIWEYRFPPQRLHWDHGMCRLHGLEPDNAPKSLAGWRDRVHPADRFRAKRAILAVLRSNQLRTEHLRVLLPSGECRHLRLHLRRVAQGDGAAMAAGEPLQVLGVCYDDTEQRLASARVEQLALIDMLTGLPNRRLLLDRLQHAIDLTHRQNSYRAVMLLDLDGFKRINDTRGHAIGDQLLIALAERLRQSLRRTDTAARLGGDEFVVLCEGLSAVAEQATREAASIAAKLARIASTPYELAGAGQAPLHCSTSIGITLFANADCDADELIKQADIAMYEAKREGRNTWRFFKSSMQRAIEDQEARTQALRQALEHDELVLRYLPQVDANGHWCGCEALLRWAASDDELRRPDEFLGLAESSGLIQAIDDWVLQRACRDFASMGFAADRPDVHLGVNISVRQLLDPDCAERVLRTVQAAGLKPHHVRLEVTEQSLFVNAERAQVAIEALQGAGIAVVLDDFGTGSSSLMQLQRLAFQAVKIDQALVRDIENKPTRRAIVRAAISVAKAFSLPVIAEGVENGVQHEILRSEGCTVFQGYHFAPPMPLVALAGHFQQQGR